MRQKWGWRGTKPGKPVQQPTMHQGLGVPRAAQQCNAECASLPQALEAWCCGCTCACACIQA